jgi:hypothetical protein
MEINIIEIARTTQNKNFNILIQNCLNFSLGLILIEILNTFPNINLKGFSNINLKFFLNIQKSPEYMLSGKTFCLFS